MYEEVKAVISAGLPSQLQLLSVTQQSVQFSLVRYVCLIRNVIQERAARLGNAIYLEVKVVISVGLPCRLQMLTVLLPGSAQPVLAPTNVPLDSLGVARAWYAQALLMAMVGCAAQIPSLSE
jgi:hypothetical protein